MNVDLIFQAITFAAHAHRNQRRRYQGVPYVNHLLRVAEKASNASLSTEAIMAATLHDILEDTETKEEDLRAHFSEEVILLVKLLTKWWPDDATGPEVASNKAKYYQEILKNEEATNLKLLDRADNVSDFVRSLPEASNEARKYLLESDEEFGPLIIKSRNEIVKSIYFKSLEALRHALMNPCS